MEHLARNAPENTFCAPENTFCAAASPKTGLREALREAHGKHDRQPSSRRKIGHRKSKNPTAGAGFLRLVV